MEERGEVAEVLGVVGRQRPGLELGQARPGGQHGPRDLEEPAVGLGLLGRRQRGGVFGGQLGVAVGGAAVEVLDLVEQHGRQVDRQLEARELAHHLGHVHVVLGRVKPHPGLLVHVGAGHLGVLRLVLVPHDGHMQGLRRRRGHGRRAGQQQRKGGENGKQAPHGALFHRGGMTSEPYDTRSGLNPEKATEGTESTEARPSNRPRPWILL
ncbi:hypothetical protein D3C72_1089510 [compost metagenome]